MIPLLPFQRAILDKLLYEDALCITGQGLGLERVLTELCRICSTKNALVLLINCEADEELRIQHDLLELSSGEAAEPPQLQLVNSDTSPINRYKLYLQGGIMSITSRILLVDMLNQNIPLHMVTGIIVNNAHRVKSDGNEAFILKLYKETNNEGFIKALSDRPESFVKDFAGVESVLKFLMLRKLHLWPRFQVEVKGDLSTKINVVEYKQPMTPKMIEAQQTILDCMVATVNEIKRINRYVDYEEIEYSITFEFERKIRRDLAPYWHRVNAKTKKLVSDLSTLRSLMHNLMDYNCVLFNTYLDSLLVSSVQSKGSVFSTSQESEWMLTDSGNLLFNIARQRTFKLKSSLVNFQTEQKLKALNLSPTLELVLEPQPKWQALSDVLTGIINSSAKEIQTHKIASSQDKSKPRILIMVNSDYVMHQLVDYLAGLKNPIKIPYTNQYATPSVNSDKLGRNIDVREYHPFLINELRSYFQFKRNISDLKSGFNDPRQTNNPDVPISNTGSATFKGQRPGSNNGYVNKRRRVRGASLAAVNPRSVLFQTHESAIDLENQTQILAESLSQDSQDYIGERKAINDDLLVYTRDLLSRSSALSDLSYGIISPEDVINIKAYSGSNDSRMLNDLNPSHVIMYNPNIAFIRQLEAYFAQNPEKNIQATFLVYDNSIEEQKYLNDIRREKEAFEKLIHTNSVMVIPLQPVYNAELESNYRNNLLRKIAPLNSLGTQNSEVYGKNGQMITDSKYRVIVDMREFRASLPFALYKSRPKGFSVGRYVEIVPRTLTVGDYILHDECCVERKSVPDLIQSLSSGRLYSQSQAMSKYYKFPLILIEFESNLSFSLSNIRDYNTEVLLSDISSKLVLLILTFPKLRILWSTSPEMSAKYFVDLKEKHPEPDIDKAVQMGDDNDSTGAESQYNSASFEFLQSLPGVGYANSFKLANKVNNFAQLCSLSVKEISGIIGSASGPVLHKFLHNS